MRALVALDDGEYAAIVAESLRFNGHDPLLVGSVASARRRTLDASIELGVIDPWGDGGLALVRALREAAPGSAIICLGGPGGCADVLAAFAAGADDYLVQPFCPAELVARVRSLARRCSARAQPDFAGAERVECGLVLDAERGRAYVNGVDLRCTPLEFAILGRMAALPGQPLPHAFLNARVWNYPNLADNTLRKGHISAIRRKLRAAGAGGMLRAVQGAGYSLGA